MLFRSVNIWQRSVSYFFFLQPLPCFLVRNSMTNTSKFTVSKLRFNNLQSHSLQHLSGYNILEAFGWRGSASFISKTLLIIGREKIFTSDSFLLVYFSYFTITFNLAISVCSVILYSSTYNIKNLFGVLLLQTMHGNVVLNTSKRS